MKVKILLITLLFIVALTACGKDKCVAKGCKNEATITGLCTEHTTLTQEELSTPEKTEFAMEKIEGINIERAETFLSAKGIDVNIEVLGEWDSAEPRGCICLQSIEEGEIIKKGDTVYVYISNGKGTTHFSDTSDASSSQGSIYNDILNNPDNYMMVSHTVSGTVDDVSIGTTLGAAGMYTICLIDSDGNTWGCVSSSYTVEGSTATISGDICGTTTLHSSDGSRKVPLMTNCIVY